MTITSNQVAAMLHANISHSDRYDAMRRYFQQLVLNATYNADIYAGWESATSSSTNTRRNLYDNGNGELEEGDILETCPAMMMTHSHQQTSHPTRTMAKPRPLPVVTSFSPLLPTPYPIREVEFYYTEHNRRLTSTYAARLNHLLRTPAAMRVFSLYNTWLNSSGWDLHGFPVPPPGPELEVLSLAMAVEIDNRWAARKEPQNMEIWGNGRAGKCMVVKGLVERMGSLLPMSPAAHSFHPFWLPDTE